MKKLLAVMLVVISVMNLQACNQKEANTGAETEIAEANQNENESTKVATQYQLPSKQTVLITDLMNCDITYCCNIEHSFCLDFGIVSTEPLEEDKLKITFDSDVKFSYGIGEDDADTDAMSYPLFLAYNKQKYIGEDADISEEEYQKIVDEIPELYAYDVGVNFQIYDSVSFDQIVVEDKLINHITLEYDGQSYTYDIGNIVFDYETKSEEIGENELLPLEGGAYRMGIAYNPDGIFSVKSLYQAMQAEEDVIIKNISVVNAKEYSMQEAELIVQNEENSMAYVWQEGTNTVIPKGSYVDFSLTMQSDKLKNAVGCSLNPLVRIDYEVDGKLQSVYHENTYWMYEFDRYELYAYLVDGIDIFDYYVNDTYTTQIEEEKNEE